MKHEYNVHYVRRAGTKTSRIPNDALQSYPVRLTEFELFIGSLV